MSMSLVKTLASASKFRRTLRKAGSKIGLKGVKNRKGLRGGMWAKKGAIGAAYNVKAMRAGMAMGAKAGKTGAKSAPYGKAYGYGHALRGQAIGHFAKRYPKTQFAIQAGKVASIGALGAWILNDDDKKA
tara:strand:+ start:201 stop:590 length:390 start_codon:yes stop_codon:yes gene_type:complete